MRTRVAAGFLFLGATASWASGPVTSPELAQHRYEPARPGRTLEFPKDHGAHREAAYEWWYLTGHLFADAQAQKERAGFQLTVFRISPVAGPVAAGPGRPERASTLIAHLALSDLETGEHVHRSFAVRERAGAAGFRVADTGIDLRLPGLSVVQDPGGALRLDARFSVNGVEREISGRVASKKPLVLHGDRGYSRKGRCETCASHYSSWTRLEGSLKLRSGERQQDGFARVWYDHEFGSNSLEKGQAGWDWFALQLDSGWDVMLFQLRDLGQRTDFVSGTWVDPQGRTGSIDPARLHFQAQGAWKSTRSGAQYPGRFQVRWTGAPAGVPELFEVVPKLPDQEVSGGDSALATYWEGTCQVQQGQRVLGHAYLEMTGYDAAHRPRF